MIAVTYRDDAAGDESARGGAAEPAPAPLTLLVGYGRGTPSLTSGLERAGLTVRAFDRLLAARAEIARSQPDLILVGGDPTDGSPLQFIRELQENRAEGMVFFLSPTTDARAVAEALEAGADDVCGPPHSVGAIVVRHLVNLKRRMTPPRPGPQRKRRLSLGGVTVDPTTREVSDGSGPFTLSGRELELLVRLMEAAGDVVPRSNLLREIWGTEQEDDAVLDATVHRLRKRLEERLQRPGFVATVRGVGYRLRKD